jgi:hypothetical protein
LKQVSAHRTLSFLPFLFIFLITRW